MFQGDASITPPVPNISTLYTLVSHLSKYILNLDPYMDTYTYKATHAVLTV